MRECAAAAILPAPLPPEPKSPRATLEKIRALAWERCGIVRSGDRLQAAQRWLLSRPLGGPPHYELRNVHQVLTLIAECAIARVTLKQVHNLY